MNTAGWLAAAVTTCVVLFSVPGFDAALSIALVVGPFAGLLVHAVAIAVDRQPTVDFSADPLGSEF